MDALLTGTDMVGKQSSSALKFLPTIQYNPNSLSANRNWQPDPRARTKAIFGWETPNTAAKMLDAA